MARDQAFTFDAYGTLVDVHTVVASSCCVAGGVTGPAPLSWVRMALFGRDRAVTSCVVERLPALSWSMASGALSPSRNDVVLPILLMRAGQPARPVHGLDDLPHPRL